MTLFLKRRAGETLYENGYALFLEKRYLQALAELQRAEDAFRKLDARGHPFTTPLSNGVSGLANTLALSGQCWQLLGNYEKAVRLYETSLINAKFEKKKPFQTFMKTLQQNMLFCLQKKLECIDRTALQEMITQEPDIDVSYRFPFSLREDSILFARLYELAPDQHRQFKDFYTRARHKDAGMRRNDRSSDESSTKRMSVTIWGILFIITVVYIIVLIKAALQFGD
jgi:tetratricopeptide (TPR) repeat protein